MKKSLASLLIDELNSLGNPIAAEHAQRFFKTGKGQYGEGDQFIGISNPVLRGVCKRYKQLGIADLQRLLDSPIHEHRLAALVIMSNSFSKSSHATQDDMYDLYMRNLRNNRINNWDLIDISAQHIIGEYLLDKPADPLYDMARSHNLWVKRASILSTFAFLRSGDATHTIRLAEILLFDAHDLIQKAVGWLMREVGKKAGEATLLAFLDKHAHEMPRTALRYSIERLTKEQRSYYMGLRP
jgi:3-methyladenine DNA glycosylase AlkD